MQERNSNTQRQATGQLGQRNVRFQETPDAVRQVQDRGPGFGSSLLGGLAGLAGDLAQQKFVDRTEELYVQGQRDRYNEKSWGDVERNALTAPFIRGGFQDQDLRMQMQALNTEASKYITQQGRQLDPDAFQKWYRPKADAVLERVGKGLSRETRGSVITNLMKQEATVAELHNKEYLKYIQEHTGQVLSTEVQGLVVQAKEIQQGGGDMQPVFERAQSLLEGISTTGLPLDVQEEFVTKTMEAFFEADLTEFSAIVDPASPVYALGPLRLDSVSKVNAAKTAAMKRTEFRRSAEVHVAMHELFELQKAGKPVGTDQVHALIHMMEGTEYATAANLQKVWALKDASSSQNKAIAAEHWSQKNMPGLNSVGYSEQKGADAYGEEVLKAYPNRPAEAMQAMISKAQDNGTIPKAYTDMVVSAARAAVKTPDGAVLPYHAAVLEQFANDTEVLKDTDPITLGELQSRFPDEFKGTITTIIDRPAGMTAMDALGVSASMNNEQVLQATKGTQLYTDAEVRDYVQDQDSHGFWVGMAKRIGRFTGIAPDTVLNSDEARRTSILALEKEVQRLQGVPGNATLSLEMLYNTAAANVVKNSIPLGLYGGEVTMLHLDGDYIPSLERTAHNLGLYADGIGSTEVKRGIEELLSSTMQEHPELQEYLESGGARVFVSGGEIYAQWIPANDSDGMPSKVFKIEREELARNVAADRQEQLDFNFASEAGGAYVVRSHNTPGQTHIQATIHGKNTSGMPPALVLDYRQMLLDREAFSPTPYADGAAQSMGFGRYFAGSKRAPDEVSVEEATAWFIEDSDKALVEARKIAAEYGIEGQNSQLALAGMVYQLGAEGVRGFPKMLTELQRGNFKQVAYEARSSRWNTKTPKRVVDFLERVKLDH